MELAKFLVYDSHFGAGYYKVIFHP